MRLEKVYGTDRRPDERVDATGRRTSDRLRLLLDPGRLLAAPSLEVLLDRVAEAARSLLGASHARVYLYDPDAAELWAPSPAGRVTVPAGEGPRAQALQTLHAVRGPDGAQGHLLCAPLCGDGRLIGLLEAGDETGVFSDRSALATASLVAAQAAEVIQRFRLLTAAAQARELRREAQLAQEASSALLPARAAVPGLEALGWTRPSFAGGTDSFDYWPLADGRLALFLGDASGHGLASGLIISEVRALLHVLCDVRPQPEWLLERIHARLQQDREPGRFVAAFFGCLSPAGELRWCSAGQGPLYWRPDAEGEYLPLPAQGPPLGVEHAVRLAAGPPLHLAPGGRVAIFSDGILDADNGTGRLLGPQRLKTIFDNTGELPLAKVVELLRDVLTTWQGGEEAADDQSALIAGVSG